MITDTQDRDNPQSGQDRFKFILSKLRDVTVDNNIAKSCCPAHKDKSPSLEIILRPNDKISVKCFVGCDYKDILANIDLTPAFLYPPQQQKVAQFSKDTPLKPRIVKTYFYKKANGQPAFEIVRFEPKDFRGRKDSSQKNWSLKSVQRVPYNLPRVIKNIRNNAPIIFVEGEKDADNGNEIGLTCTTVAGGCGKWREEYAKWFKDADIIFIPDRDRPGIKGMLRIAKKLKNIAKRIRILHLPVKHKGDLSDWIEEDGDKDKLGDLITLDSIFLDEALMVDKLNKKHAVIMVQGKFVVMNEEYDPTMKRNDITFSSKNHFSDRYENHSAKITKFKQDKEAERKRGQIVFNEKLTIKSKGQIWIKSPHRRQYHGFCFNPQEEKEIEGFYNLWRGFAVKAKEGDCSLYYQHIKEVIAQGDETIYNYVLNWMADAVQNITKRTGVAIIFRGGSRAGKGLTIRLFAELFGQHFLHVTEAQQIVGNFNAHLKDCLILFADEAFYAGDKQHEATLKALITEQTRMIEYKGKDAVVLPNYTRLFMASNKEWVAPLEKDDARFFILDVSDSKTGNKKYFDAILDQMNNQKGKEALLYDLQNRDISKININDYPITQAILDNKLESLDSIGQWVFYILSSGELKNLGFSNSIFELYEKYKDFCGKQRPASYNAWQREMRKFFPGLERVQKTGESGRYYQFQSLGICREYFENRLHAKIEWDEEEGEETQFEN